MTIYSLDILLFLFGTSLLFNVQFYYCFLTYIQVSQGAGQVVWYSYLFQDFPQFIVIHTVKAFVTVNKAEIDVFLELSCFFDYPANAGNLVSSSSAFSKSSLNIMTIFFNMFVATDTLNSIVCVILIFAYLLCMSWYYTHDGTNDVGLQNTYMYVFWPRILLVCVKYPLNFLTIVFYFV